MGKYNSWIIRGMILGILLIAFQPTTYNSDAWYYSDSYTSTTGSRIQVIVDVAEESENKTDYLEWKADIPYSVNIFVVAQNFGTNINGMFTLDIKCKWTNGIDNYEGLLLAHIPDSDKQLDVVGDQTPGLFNLTISNPQTTKGSLQYRIWVNEDQAGSDVLWDTNWQDAVSVDVDDPIIPAIVGITIASFALITIIGSRRT